MEYSCPRFGILALTYSRVWTRFPPKNTKMIKISLVLFLFGVVAVVVNVVAAALNLCACLEPSFPLPHSRCCCCLRAFQVPDSLLLHCLLLHCCPVLFGVKVAGTPYCCCLDCLGTALAAQTEDALTHTGI